MVVCAAVADVADVVDFEAEFAASWGAAVEVGPPAAPDAGALVAVPGDEALLAQIGGAACACGPLFDARPVH